MRYLMSLVILTFLFSCTQSKENISFKEKKSGIELKVPQNYATIQEAIENASTGDTVLIEGGKVYQEDLTINKPIEIKGDEGDVPVLLGTVKITNVSEGEVKVENIEISGISGSETAIDIENATAIVQKVKIHDVNIGIQVDIENPELYSHIVGNEISNCAKGIEIGDSEGEVMVVNNIIYNNKNYGIDLIGIFLPKFVKIVNNTVVLNGFNDSLGCGINSDAMSGSVEVVNNIVVSNNTGLNLMDSEIAVAHHNLVWGNIVNYNGMASVGTGDITKDPYFKNPQDFDFHLMFNSPAIDSGTDEIYATFDFDGFERPQGDGIDMGAYEYISKYTKITIAINEVMANPLNEKTGEFVELYNYGDSPVDVAGLIIDDGDSTDVIIGMNGGTTVIPPKGYGVILDPDYNNDYEIPEDAVLLTIKGNSTIGSGLSNSDPVYIIDPKTNFTIDSYSFPFNPGNGISVEKDSIEDGDVKTNWVPSPCGSTPGKENCASLPPNVSKKVLIAINEIMANPLNEDTGEFIELYNFGDEPVDVGGFKFSDGDTTDTIVGWNGGTTLILPGQYALILDPEYNNDYDIPENTVLLTVANSTDLGNGLATSDPVTLFDKTGLTVIDSYTHFFNPGNGKSVEKVDPTIGDIESNFMASTCGSGSSPGKMNCVTEEGNNPVSGYTIAITEVMANPIDEDTGEYIELYNYGDEPVDVAGFRISDGDAVDTIWGFEGGTTIIPPKSYALILDKEYKGEYNIPDGTILLTTDDTTIGSGLSNNDPIVLKSETGAAIIDSFSFPFNPGNGISIEKIDLVVGDVEANWVASPCGSSPGQLNCASGGEKSEISIYSLVISEVMANPLNENTGEFIEIFNAGSKEIDLKNFVISDGDSKDTIEGFNGGDTVLAPGKFAVILDKDYSGEYNIPDDVLLLTVDDSKIGNGLSTSDPITLYEPDGTTVVSTFSFPYNPGNGKSIEKVILTGEDVKENWKTSTCLVENGELNDYASPGTRNCVDPYGSKAGTAVFGEPCPSGGIDCLSGLCAVDLLSMQTFCTIDCSNEECPENGECVSTIDVNYPFICVPTSPVCEDECQKGEKQCVDDKTFQVCDDFDGDGCTEWGGEKECSSWSFCSNGKCVQKEAPFVLINEVLYDAVGADKNVFVELYGDPGTTLDGFVLVGINGADGKLYKAISLSGTIPDDGFFVIAHPESDSWIKDNADLLTKEVDFQNGPDSIELLWGTTVVDAIGYGDFSGGAVFAGEGNPAIDVDAGFSLTRDENHTDTNDNSVDFTPTDNPTPGY